MVLNSSPKHVKLPVKYRNFKFDVCFTSFPSFEGYEAAQLRKLKHGNLGRKTIQKLFFQRLSYIKKQLTLKCYGQLCTFK